MVLYVLVLVFLYIALSHIAHIIHSSGLYDIWPPILMLYMNKLITQNRNCLSLNISLPLQYSYVELGQDATAWFYNVNVDCNFSLEPNLLKKKWPTKFLVVVIRAGLIDIGSTNEHLEVISRPTYVLYVPHPVPYEHLMWHLCPSGTFCKFMEYKLSEKWFNHLNASVVINVLLPFVVHILQGFS